MGYKPRRAARPGLGERLAPPLQRLGAAAAVTAVLGGLGVVAHTGLTQIGQEPVAASSAEPEVMDRDDLLRANRNGTRSESPKPEDELEDVTKDLPRSKAKPEVPDVSTPPPTDDPTGSGGSGDQSDGDQSDGDESGGGESGGGDSTAPCPTGSQVEQGLVPNAIKVHRDVCHRFPQITTYGGVRADALPEHPSGRALDIMIPDNATGWQIARYVQANAGRLGVSQVIFDQQIWTVQRSGEGWRGMPDRGGDTANHRDHVHVTVY